MLYKSYKSYKSITAYLGKHEKMILSGSVVLVIFIIMGMLYHLIDIPLLAFPDFILHDLSILQSLSIGIFVSQVVYISLHIQYDLNRQAFKRYVAYLSISLFVALTTLLHYTHPTLLPAFLFPLMIAAVMVGYGLYFDFSRYFMEIEGIRFRINKWMKGVEVGIFTATSILLIAIWTKAISPAFAYFLWAVISFVPLCIATYLLYHLRAEMQKLRKKYFYLSGSFLMIGVMIECFFLFQAALTGEGNSYMPPQPYWAIAIGCGVIMEMVFLNVGIANATRATEKEALAARELANTLKLKGIEDLKALKSLRERLTHTIHSMLSGRFTAILLDIKLVRTVIERGKGSLTQYLNVVGLEIDGLTWSLSMIKDLIKSGDPANYQIGISLEQVGFVKQVKATCQLHFALVENMTVTFDIDPNIAQLKYPKKEINIMLQIIEEAVNNALKYAFPDEHKKGKILIIRLFVDKERDLITGQSTDIDRFYIVIQDNGKGFDSTQLSRKNGIDMLKVDAERIKGTATFTSALYEGTTWEFSFPIALYP